MPTWAVLYIIGRVMNPGSTTPRVLPAPKLVWVTTTSNHTDSQVVSGLVRPLPSYYALLENS